jgi:Uma2 family endonuclease
MTIKAVAAPKIAREARKFTVEEYFAMAEAGILKSQEKVELIEGEILIMPPTGPHHSWGVSRYIRIFMSQATDRFCLLTQSTVRLGEDFAPEPDMALLKYREDEYYSAHATPEDILLMVEVADSSAAYDRDVKAHLYGRAGIPETWVLNLPGDCIERFMQPGPEGYGEHTVLRRGERVSPVSLSDLELDVNDLLPPMPDTQT